MTIQEALQDAARHLQPRKISCAADKDLGRLDAEILLAHVLKKDRAWLVAHRDAMLPVRAFKTFRAYLRRRIKHEPIAYLIGEKEFYRLTFQVNHHVLIPRPETEMLVTLPLSVQKRKIEEAIVWDVGTGSGCVAITIAKHLLAATILATDTSTEALKLARQNAKRHKVTNVSFLKADLYDANVRRWFASYGKNIKRLIIVANLPYLPNADKKKLAPDIVKYEPHDALFAGKTGRECIETFLRQIAAFGIQSASIFLEFDPPQATKLRTFAKKLFPHTDITIHKDLAHRDRVLEIHAPNV